MKPTRQNRIQRELKERKNKMIRLVVIILSILIFLDIFYHFSNNFRATLLIGILILFIAIISQLGGNIQKSDRDGSHFDSGHYG